MDEKNRKTLHDKIYEGEKKSEKKITDLTEEDLPKMMPLDGERIKIDSIINKNFVINDVIMRPSAFSDGEYAVLEIDLDGKTCFVYMSSPVVINQIKQNEEKLPFKCSITKQRSMRNKNWTYYTLIPAINLDTDKTKEAIDDE